MLWRKGAGPEVAGANAAAPPARVREGTRRTPHRGRSVVPAAAPRASPPGIADRPEEVRAMMRRIIAWSMQLRLLMVAAAAVVIFFGLTELRKMPLDVLPEFTQPRVEIQTEALGLSAAEVEAMITVPLEAVMLNGAPCVKPIRSESIPVLSSIVLEFEPGTDLLAARQMAQERMVQVFVLPNVSKPPVMLQPISSTSRFLKVGVTSDSRSLID